MAEVNRYLDAFLVEARDLLEQIEAACLDLENNPNHGEAINRLFRSVHTLKGTGGMFGLDEVAGFTHHLESVLDAVRNERVSVNAELIGVALQSKDLIQAMIDARSGGPKHDQDLEQQLVKQILSFLPSELAEPGAAAIQGAPPLETLENPKVDKLYRIRFYPQHELYKSGTDPISLLDELRDLGELVILKSEVIIADWHQFDPENCYLGWEMLLKTHVQLDAVQDVFIFVEHVSDLKIDEEHDLLHQDEDPKLGEILVRSGVSEHKVQEALASRKKIGEILTEAGVVSSTEVKQALTEQKVIKQLKDNPQEESIRVSSARLNQMINLVGELVIFKAQLAQIANSVGRADLSSSVESIERLIAELRDNVLNVRMIPIGTTFGRFKRLVRDLSQDLGKQINLETIGEETELDKAVVDKLADPLIHMIRNSADHGLESTAERLAAGKSEHGQIRLIAEHRGSSVQITVEDDGRGINTDAVRQRAMEKGLIQSESNLSEQDIYHLIFQPGFSTAEKVTNVSGRGVGMDVVKRQIEALKGSIQIHSQKGQGSRFVLTLPLTMSIIDGILVEIEEERFVLPVGIVEECAELRSLDGTHIHGRHVVQVRGEMIPYLRLRELFHNQNQGPNNEQVVIVQVGKKRIGLVVDRVIGDHQTVVKSLGDLYKHNPLVSGATIMGDGRVALILDANGIVDFAVKDNANLDLKELVYV